MVTEIKDRLQAQQWKDEEVKITPIAPPPEPKPSTKADIRPLVAPRPDIVITPADPTSTVRDIEVAPIKPAEIGPLTTIEARSIPVPNFAVRAASPKGAPGSWVSDRDYPSAAIREEREGLTRFRLAIGTDGRVAGCEITGSSGSPDLDAATCAKVTARARFVPALGSDGMPTTGSYNGSVRWVLP
ncbi:TonB family protein [Novosphingobium sp. 1Y9A]|uniref:TonB family protein n=2 Tax=Novosphingobium jiangmenense TaxID=2791981 RepID=A0ABS0HDI7_9SPHN|nr:TonB family protein [Novosphingobium jiangmenense]